MTDIPVRFVYVTGLADNLFHNVRLLGSWDPAGRLSDQWTEMPMVRSTGEDDCPVFSCVFSFAATEVNRSFRWGVQLDGPSGPGQWGIPTEIKDARSNDRTRSFTLLPPAPVGTPGQEERYYLTHCRRLGAQKLVSANGDTALRFAVWAPHARAVEVLFGVFASGYINDRQGGQDPARPPIPLRKATRSGRQDDPDWDGVWESSVSDTPTLGTYNAWDHAPYMFRVTRDDGSVVLRTDLHSRCQIGAGPIDPKRTPFSGRHADLDGKVSCAAVIDPDTVTRTSKTAEWPADRDNGLFVPAAEFWRGEYVPAHPLPTRLEDLVIYELHIASLGPHNSDDNGCPMPGTFDDAIDLLDTHLVPLGVNAVELMPVAEFGGGDEWGYGDTHLFALEFRSGGRDQLKHFVRACHQRGIAVILDVVYNHFALGAERAQWMIDSTADDRNPYYWYEGRPSDWPSPDGGYCDNGSTGYAPRFWEENVRKLFISAAAALVSEFHVDGFRVDLTQAIHSDNRLHADGRAVDAANQFGAKFLREWSRTLKMIRPATFLIAEEHSDRVAITTSPDAGGMGFDATWFVDFYHNLVDTPGGDSWARMIAIAGLGDDRPLRLDWFASSLEWSRNRTVVYHMSHDEAGNSGSGDPNPDKRSHRTIVTAVHGAPLVGTTRRFAEARCRIAAGLALLAPATPMFLMGEEVGAARDYRYNDFMANREDLLALQTGDGSRLFLFYRDLIAFRRAHPALRSREIDILHVSPENRVLAFRRQGDGEDLLVFASLANHPFAAGYGIAANGLGDANWREEFNSDADVYGGDNIGNGGAVIPSHGGSITAVLPANGLVVFRRI